MMVMKKHQMLKSNIKIVKEIPFRKTTLDHVYEHILSDGNKKPYMIKDGKRSMFIVHHI